MDDQWNLEMWKKDLMVLCYAYQDCNQAATARALGVSRQSVARHKDSEMTTTEAMSRIIKRIKKLNNFMEVDDDIVDDDTTTDEFGFQFEDRE